MPFTPEQIRAIAADRNRRHGDADTYLHNLKRKTLKHKEQWGHMNVRKASRYGGEGAIGNRQDEFAKSKRGNFSPEADRQRRLGAYMAASALLGGASAGGAVHGAHKESKEARELARAAGKPVKYLTATRGRTKLLAAGGAGGLWGARRIYRHANSDPNKAWM